MDSEKEKAAGVLAVAAASAAGRDKAAGAEAKQVAGKDGKAEMRRDLAGYASVRNAVIRNRTSAVCRALKSPVPRAAWPCAVVDPRRLYCGIQQTGEARE
ncbi:MAG TPA: hypothetical protein PKI11_21620 [Candidatus Hydrogenedentes bacterium]|nr:hypothetical protein [Candidatus Hydrogenedentota bacterium]